MDCDKDMGSVSSFGGMKMKVKVCNNDLLRPQDQKSDRTKVTHY